MPVPITTLKEDLPIGELITLFFAKKADPSMGYAIHEIIAGAFDKDPDTLQAALLAASEEKRKELLVNMQRLLDRLLKQGKVRRYKYQGDVYYARAG